MRCLPSFTRLLRIILRVLGSLERRRIGKHIRVVILETFLISWGVETGFSNEGKLVGMLTVVWSSFFRYVANVSLDDLKDAVARVDIEAGYCNGTSNSLAN